MLLSSYRYKMAYPGFKPIVDEYANYIENGLMTETEVKHRILNAYRLCHPIPVTEIPPDIILVLQLSRIKIREKKRKLQLKEEKLEVEKKRNELLQELITEMQYSPNMGFTVAAAKSHFETLAQDKH